MEYRPLLPYVILSFAEIESLYSRYPPDREIGWVPEHDVAFWILTAAVKRELGVPVPQRLACYIPFIFVDEPQALLSGREVYGFPKEWSTIGMQWADGDPGPLSVTTYCFPGPDTEVQRKKLVKVSRVPEAPSSPPLPAWESHEGFLKGLWKEIRAGEEGLVISGRKFLFHVLDELLKDKLLKEEVNGVFLKEFRDVEDGTKACYQAILEAPIRLTAFQGAGLLPGRYRLDLTPCECHPIATDLGLTPESITGLRGFWLEFSFNLDNGRVIWQAG